MTSRKNLTEQDIRTKYITPAIVETAGWDSMRQVREEVYFTAGRIWVRGNLTKRGKAKKADYILYYKPNIPLAIIEAKDNNHSVGAGMQQALEYAEILDIPFVYSSNGDGFVEHDRTLKEGKIEKDLQLSAFPSPSELWARYKEHKDIKESKTEKIVTQDYYREDAEKQPRYYQEIAINRTIEAIAKGQDRILLVMATGTGKTLVAFQIIWRLWKANKKKRILFLADRNFLIDQTKTNDFKPFDDKMTKITGRKVNKAFQIYLALYQAITGPEENQKIYRKFSPDFFDLIVIDELIERGVFLEDIIEEAGREYDAFDLICHVAFDRKPLTRKERAENVKKRDYFTKYGEPARAVVEALLEKYANEGIGNIEDIKVLNIPPFTGYGSITEIIESFGGKENYLRAVKELEDMIYGAA